MKNIKILKKLELNKRLSKEEIFLVVDDYVNDKITDKEMAAFLKLVYKNGLSFNETVYLTEAMLNSGDIVNLSEIKLPKVDKHSTGGVGDKVSLILGPIVAAAGLCFPKMSGKGLGFTGGTVDKLESIEGYKVKLTEKDFLNQLKECGIGIISQTKNIAPADKKIYDLRNKTNTTDSIPLIASSIMSKKLASGSNIIVIDLKVGSGAFMKNVRSATTLAKTMIKIGQSFNKKVICVLTDMSTPLGTCVGNKLEVAEAIEYFENKRDKKLDTVVRKIATYMVSFGKNIPINKARKIVNNVIESGKAKDKFYEWIKFQGGKIEKLEINSEILNIKSPKTGYIKYIDASLIGELSKSLGAGRINKNDEIDTNVGIKIHKPVSSKVKEGDLIATIYYNKKITNMEKKLMDAYTFTYKKPKNKPVILKIIK